MSESIFVPCLVRNALGGGEPPTAEFLVLEAMSVFDKTENALPCSRLALTVHEFVGLVSGRRSIASFLRAPSPSTLSASPVAGHRPIGEPDEGNEGGVTSPSRAARAVKCGSGSYRREAAGSGEVLLMEGARSSQSTGRSNVGRSCDEQDVGSSQLQPGEERCPKCGEAFASDKLSEHLDFHYAEGLQERYTREGSVAADIVAIGSDRGVTKRRANGDKRGATRRPKTKQHGRGGSSGGAMARIDSFFKPAS